MYKRQILPLGAAPQVGQGRAEIWVVLPGDGAKWPASLPEGTVLVQKNAQTGQLELLPAQPGSVVSVALLIAPNGLDIKGVRG